MPSSKNSVEKKAKVKKSRKSVVDFLYKKLLRDPSTNVIIFIVAFVFIIWMVIPLLLVFSGAIYIPGAEPINYYFSGAINAEQIGNQSKFFSFIVPENTSRIKVILQLPKKVDFDISLWNEEGDRAGGRTLNLTTGDIISSEEVNIPNGKYNGISSKLETITIEPPETFGNWSIGCFAHSGEGQFTITVNIKAGEGGRFSFQAIMYVFTGTTFFNAAGDKNTHFYTKVPEEWGGPSSSVTVSDDIVFVAEKGDGIEILDVSDTASITEIHQYFDITGVSAFYDLTIKDNLLFAASGQTGLSIFNITDVYEDFSLLSNLEGYAPGIENATYETKFVRIVDNLAFIDRNDGGFSIIDISDPQKPMILSNVTIDTKSENIAIQDNFVYVVGYDTGIKIFNISNPYHPELLKDYKPTETMLGNLRTHDIKIVNDLAFLALDDGFGVCNISDPANITLVNSITGFTTRRIEISEDYAYLIAEKTVGVLRKYGLIIANIENFGNITVVSEFLSISIKTTNIFLDIVNNRVFLAQLRDGTNILDLSDVNNPISIGVYGDTIDITIHTFSGVNRGVVLNTIILGISTTVFSIILGTALAFILARYEFPGKKLFSVLALAPLIVPPFISGMGFRLLLGPEGFLNNLFLVPVFQIKLILTGFIAICYVQTSHFYALIYLNAFSSFINIDPSMEEQAENLGAGSARLFTTVTLPLAMPGIGAGSILVLILSMEDVGTPIIFASMGDNDAKHYLTYYVFENIQKAGQIQVDAITMVLAAILLIIALIGFFIIRKYVSLRKYAMISKGRAGAYRLSKPGWKSLFIYPFLILLFALSLLVHVGVFLMSILENLGARTANDVRFTFDFYRAVFSPKSSLAQIYKVTPYIVNTLVYSIIATVVIVVLGSLAAYVISRKEFKGKGIMDALVTIPIAIPGIALAIGYYSTFDWSGIASSNPTRFNIFMAKTTEVLRLDPFASIAIVLLVMSYAIRKFPFTVRSAFAGLQQTDVVLEEASFNLGAGRVKTFGKITIPLISLNIFAGSLVSFLYCLSEVSTTIFLILQAEAGTITWFMAWNPLRFQIFCALGVVLMLLQILSLFITNVILGSRAEAITGI